jgi:hypothetical protein
VDSQNKFVNAGQPVSVLIISDNKASSFLDVLLELHWSEVSRELDALDTLEGIEVFFIFDCK